MEPFTEPSVMIDRKSIKRYFTRSAKKWVDSGYGDADGYTYPTGAHRMSTTCRVLASLGRPLSVLDLGCGGGNLAAALAEDGNTVIGVDESEEMLGMARRLLSSRSAEVQDRVRLRHSSIEGFVGDGTQFDAVTALGLIGYLPNDDILFEKASKVLKPHGLLVISCRNRLFNMVSFSFRTVGEIREGTAVELLQEIEELYQSVPPEDVGAFLNSLANASRELADDWAAATSVPFKAEDQEVRDGKMSIEPRQQTPKGMREAATRNGYSTRALLGVHPHLMDPRLNRLLPPKVFNRLSASLEPLADLPVALVWSSLFIGVFEKNGHD